MAKVNSSEIIIVLDRSGSMQERKQETIGGFNSFLEEQKAEPGECRFTLTQFDNEYEVVLDGVPLMAVPPLTDESYVPRGFTALLDAIGKTVNVADARIAAMPEDQRPSRVLFVVLTDGMENASKEFKRATVFEKIKEQQDTHKWQFVFIGAAQDQIGEAGDLGIRTCAAYDGSKKGATKEMYASLSCQTSVFRGGGQVDPRAIVK